LKYFLFETGCKLNQSLMNRVAGEYELKMWERTDNVKDADVILMASCVVTKKAETDFLRVFNRFKRLYPQKRIEISGCFSGESGENVNFIDQERILQIENPSSFRTRPEVVIQTGCNNFCSYCIVPYKRGAERSRNVDDILFDVNKYISEGKKEVVLTGVHIGKYESNGMNLTSLIKAIKKSGIFRIRLSSLDINEISDELIEEISKDNITARFLHLSLQHTEDPVLKSMLRNTDKRKIFERIAVLKSIRGMRIGADIIYNFPTETGEIFEDLLISLKSLPITHFHLFAYSKREGTLAAYFSDSNGNRDYKLSKLKELATAKKQNYLESIIGKPDEIIIERIKEDLCYGKSSGYVNCKVKTNGEIKTGEIVKVIFESAEDSIMYCRKA